MKHGNADTGVACMDAPAELNRENSHQGLGNENMLASDITIQCAEEEETLKLCARIRECLNKRIEDYKKVRELLDNWREGVFTGAVPFHQDEEAECKRSISKWLSGEGRLQSLISVLFSERCEPGMRAAADYQKCVDEANIMLAQWKSPQRTDEPALRMTVFNKEQAAQFRRFAGQNW
jgi:hypothetical protein